MLLDKVLADMDSLELNAHLEAVTGEKQDILDQMEAWLDQQPMCFTEYDDTITHKFIERITVVDAGSIQVKIRDVDVVISKGLC